MNKRQMDRCKYYFEELEKYFKEKIEEELESITTNIEEYRRIEGLTYAIELLKDVENSY